MRSREHGLHSQLHMSSAFAAVVGILIAILFLSAPAAHAAEFPIPRISIGVDSAGTPEDVAVSVQVLILLTILALAPAILIMMTAFTRIVIVLSLTRSALATNQTPPNQVIIGLALFLTFYVMAPTFQVMNEEALQPYLEGTITQEEALGRAQEPLREFMMTQTREKDLELFYDISDREYPATPEDVPFSILVPAFVLSELKSAFQIGFAIFIPFIVIDMVVSSTLMAMGMLMLPPVMISLPFKILLFVMVDGWNLIARSLLLSFR